MKVWAAPSTRTCFKNSIPKRGDSAAYTLRGARGELLSFQILLRNNKTVPGANKETDCFVAVTGVKVTQLSGGEYDVSSVRVQVQEYISFEDAIAYPDPIANDCKAVIPPSVTQGMWVTFPVDRGQAAGEYRFRIAFAFDTDADCQNGVDVTIKVYDVTIPESKDGNYSVEHF